MKNDDYKVLGHRERVVFANRVGSIAGLVFVLTVSIGGFLNDVSDVVFFLSVIFLVWASYAQFHYMWDENDASLEEFAKIAGLSYTQSSALTLVKQSALATGTLNNYRVIEAMDGTFSDYSFTLAALQTSEQIYRGKGRMRKFYSLLAIDLDEDLPHVVLDSSANNKFFVSSIPAKIDESQRISLEGDFDQSFRVYARKKHANEVLDILSPDFMDTLLSLPKTADIEIVDNQALIYIHSGALTEAEVKSLMGIGSNLASSLEKKMKSWKPNQEERERLAIDPGDNNFQLIAGFKNLLADKIMLTIVLLVYSVFLYFALINYIEVWAFVVQALFFTAMVLIYGSINLRFWSR